MDEFLRLILPVLLSPHARFRINLFANPNDARSVQLLDRAGTGLLVQGSKDPEGRLVDVRNISVRQPNSRPSNILYENDLPMEIDIPDVGLVEIQWATARRGRFSVVLPNGSRRGPIDFEL